MAENKKRLSSFSQKEITTLFNTIKVRFKKGGLSLRFAPTQKEYARLLIVIPKKFGTAPCRNLLRRRLKSIFNEKKLYDEKVDVVINAYPEARQLSYAQISEILQEAYRYYRQKHFNTTH